MENNYIQIKSHKEIFLNSIGNKSRHITLIDLNNKKKIDYVLFETRHEFMWETIIKNEINNTVFPGKIITLKLTHELLNKLNLQRADVNFEDGDTLDIVVWEWISWMGNSEDIRVEWSLKEQLWKLNKKNCGKYIKSTLPKEDYYFDDRDDYPNESIYDNLYYNDNLDMDQQSLDFWENL